MPPKPKPSKFVANIEGPKVNKKKKKKNKQRVKLIRTEFGDNAISKEGLIHKLLASQKTSKEAFDYFDDNGSGALNIHEFKEMLKVFGVSLPTEKILRYFKKMDEDGSGEISKREWEKLMYIINPVTGNNLGFYPSAFLTPKDAFDMFDLDRNGAIDEDEFALVLEHLGLELEPNRLANAFHTYDRSHNGCLMYEDFVELWVRLTDVRDELHKRGQAPGRWLSPWLLMRKLEERIHEEDYMEALATEEAIRWDRWKTRNEKKRIDADRAMAAAERQLLAALDAAGQVYVFGTGVGNCMMGTPIPARGPDVATVERLWDERLTGIANRVPLSEQPQFIVNAKKVEDVMEAVARMKKEAGPDAEFNDNISVNSYDLDDATTATHTSRKSAAAPAKSKAANGLDDDDDDDDDDDEDEDEDNDADEEDDDEEEEDGDQSKAGDADAPPSARSTASDRLAAAAAVTSAAISEEKTPDELAEEAEEAELARQREEEQKQAEAEAAAAKAAADLANAVKFSGRIVAPHGAALWARQVRDVMLTDTCAFATTDLGEILVWGGQSAWWKEEFEYKHWTEYSGVRGTVPTRSIKPPAMTDRKTLFKAFKAIDEEKLDAESVPSDLPWEPSLKELRQQSHMTPRTTRLLRTLDTGQWQGESKEQRLAALAAIQRQKDYDYAAKIRLVAQYYDCYVHPPSENIRAKFTRTIVLQLLPAAEMKYSLMVRGDSYAAETAKSKEELCMRMYEVLQVEKDNLTRKQRKKLRNFDIQTRTFMAKRQIVKAQVYKTRLTLVWRELVPKLAEFREHLRKQSELDKQRELALRELNYREYRRNEQVLASQPATADLSPRGTHPVFEVGGVTTRGPPLALPGHEQKILAMFGGTHHAAILHRSAGLCTWGSGTSGRLGHGDTFDRYQPTVMEAFRGVNVISVGLGRSHSAAVTDRGILFVWGAVTSGQLGIDVTTDEMLGSPKARVQHHHVGDLFLPIPRVVKFPALFRQVACGAAHTAAVTVDGKLYVWGSANGGRLGLGPAVTRDVWQPALVESLAHVAIGQVACGSSHTIALSAVRRVVEGSETEEPRYEGGQLFGAGSTWALGKPTATFKQYTNVAKTAMRYISAGRSHNAAISVFGELFTWGNNEHGETGQSTELTFVPEPMRVDCLYNVPMLLTTPNSRATQCSTYNQHGPKIALDGETSGLGEDSCTHTQRESNAWWEVDLGQLAVVTSITLFNRQDGMLAPDEPKNKYSSRLFPCYIMVSITPFPPECSAEGLEQARRQSSATIRFTKNQRETLWLLPHASVARYVRVQLEKTNFLHFSQIKIMGTWGELSKGQPVSHVACGNATTVVVIPPLKDPVALENTYCRAIAADPASALILREYHAYFAAYDKFGFDYRPKRQEKHVEVAVEKATVKMKQVTTAKGTFWVEDTGPQAITANAWVEAKNRQKREERKARKRAAAAAGSAARAVASLRDEAHTAEEPPVSFRSGDFIVHSELGAHDKNYDIHSVLKTMDANQDPAVNLCPLCMPGQKCATCRFHALWVTRMVRKRHELMLEFAPPPVESEWEDDEQDGPVGIGEPEVYWKEKFRERTRRQEEKELKIMVDLSIITPAHMQRILEKNAMLRAAGQKRVDAARAGLTGTESPTKVGSLAAGAAAAANPTGSSKDAATGPETNTTSEPSEQPAAGAAGAPTGGESPGKVKFPKNKDELKLQLSKMRQRGIGYNCDEEAEALDATSARSDISKPGLEDILEEVQGYRTWFLSNLIDLVMDLDPPPSQKENAPPPQPPTVKDQAAQLKQRVKENLSAAAQYPGKVVSRLVERIRNLRRKPEPPPPETPLLLTPEHSVAAPRPRPPPQPARVPMLDMPMPHFDEVTREVMIRDGGVAAEQLAIHETYGIPSPRSDISSTLLNTQQAQMAAAGSSGRQQTSARQQEHLQQTATRGPGSVNSRSSHLEAHRRRRRHSRGSRASSYSVGNVSGNP